MSEKDHTVQVQLHTHKPRSRVRLINNDELEFAFPAIGALISSARFEFLMVKSIIFRPD